MDFKVEQIVYGHGGSRIYALTADGDKKLLIDTYGNDDFAREMFANCRMYYFGRGKTFKDL